jgi:peptidoglycan/xylan/chitin deacetylase (PgdA/CDA1 family)
MGDLPMVARIARLGILKFVVVTGVTLSILMAPHSASAAVLTPAMGWTKKPVCTGAPIRSVMMRSKYAALTFDDGPWPTNTLAVVKHLKTYGAKGTFFMVSNNVLYYPTIARSVYASGMEVANHAKTHKYYTASVIASEIGPARWDIYRTTGSGILTWAFRPPGLTRGWQIDQKVKYYGMCNVHTDYDIGDWRSPRISSWTICDRFKRSLHPGYIALLHDGGSHTQTVNAMPCILSYARSQGYTLVTVSQLLTMGAHAY